MPDSILPPELLDIVFDNLQPTDSTNAYETISWPRAQEVHKSLSACTLVSRSWYPLAREHLFRDVVYSFQRPPDGGPAAWADSAMDASHRWAAYAGINPDDYNGPRMRRIPLKTLQMFLDFVQQSPATRRSIRKLTLSAYPAGTPGSETDWPFALRIWTHKDDAVDPTLLMSLLSSLPRVESVRFYDVIVTQPRATQFFLPTLSVRELKIVSMNTLISSHRICNLITYFAEVGTCSLIRPSWVPNAFEPDNSTLPANFPPFFALDIHSLALSHVYEGAPLLAMSQLLQRSPFLCNLRKLCITTALATTRGLDAIMTSCGPYLEYFKLVLNCTGMFLVETIKAYQTQIKHQTRASSTRYSIYPRCPNCKNSSSGSTR